MPIITGFLLDLGSTLSTFFSVGVSLEIVSATGYTRIVRTTGTAGVLYLRNMRINYDQTAVQSTQQTYLDAEFFIGNNGVSDPYSLVFSDSSNYFAGLNNFTFGVNQLAQFSYNPNTFTLTSSGYGYINMSTLNYRYRSCIPPDIYFNEVENLCYDVCPLTYYPNTVNNYCAPCYPGCLSCVDSASTSCSSCNLTSNRLLSGT